MGCCSSTSNAAEGAVTLQGVVPGQGQPPPSSAPDKGGATGKGRKGVPPPPVDPYDLTDVAKLYETSARSLKEKVEGGEVPSVQAIGVLLRDTTTKAHSLLVKASRPSVHALCKEEYEKIGWDFHGNMSINMPPNAQQLLSGFESLSARVHSWVSEQQSQIMPTPEELGDLAKACSKLWQLDHRLQPEGGLYKINLQAGKDKGNNKDVAADPLFSYVSPEVLRRPTFTSFVALLDNYQHETGTKEVVTDEKLGEERRFLATIYSTPVIRYLHHYLTARSVVSEDVDEFKQLLHAIWFDFYGRTRNVKDTCGFETVFVGEYKANQVVGCNNWVNIYLEEKRGKLNYKGYLRPQGQGGEHDDHEQVLSINFDWSGRAKDASTIFIGTSPEFEIALYTLVLLLSNEEKVEVQLGPYQVEVACYKVEIQDSLRISPPRRPGGPPALSSSISTAHAHMALRGIHLKRNYPS